MALYSKRGVLSLIAFTLMVSIVNYSYMTAFYNVYPFSSYNMYPVNRILPRKFGTHILTTQSNVSNDDAARINIKLRRMSNDTAKTATRENIERVRSSNDNETKEKQTIILNQTRVPVESGTNRTIQTLNISSIKVMAEKTVNSSDPSLMLNVPSNKVASEGGAIVDNIERVRSSNGNETKEKHTIILNQTRAPVESGTNKTIQTLNKSSIKVMAETTDNTSDPSLMLNVPSNKVASEGGAKVDNIERVRSSNDNETKEKTTIILNQTRVPVESGTNKTIQTLNKSSIKVMAETTDTSSDPSNKVASEGGAKVDNIERVRSSNDNETKEKHTIILNQTRVPVESGTNKTIQTLNKSSIKVVAETTDNTSDPSLMHNVPSNKVASEGGAKVDNIERVRSSNDNETKEKTTIILNQTRVPVESGTNKTIQTLNKSSIKVMAETTDTSSDPSNKVASEGGAKVDNIERVRSSNDNETKEKHTIILNQTRVPVESGTNKTIQTLNISSIKVMAGTNDTSSGPSLVLNVPSNKVASEGGAIVDNTVLNESQQVVRRLPNCIIIGVRKGGTFALLQFLNIHPDIVIPDRPEIHFFDRDERYALGQDCYRNIMPQSSPGQITLEKTPEYFMRASVPPRIKQMNSSIRLLLTVRDPVTRVISDFTMKQSKYPQRYSSLESTVLNEQGEIDMTYRAIQISTYHVHLSRWLQHFSREQIYIVDGDEFARNPYKEINSIENFLGLRHAVTKKNLIYNEDKGFFCIKKTMDDESDERRCMPPGKGRKHPDVKPAVLKKLEDYFKPLNEKFFAVAGRTFDWN